MLDKPNFLEMAEDMLAAAEKGDMDAVTEHKSRFAEAGGKLYQDLCRQGFTEGEILSGAYMHDSRYKSKQE